MEKRLIIVGAGWAGMTLASEIVRRNPQQVVGFVEDNPVSEKIVVSNANGGCEIPILGHSKNLMEIVRKLGASSVAIAITHNRGDHVLRQMVQCFEEGIPVYEMPDLYAHITKKIPVEHVKHQWIIPNLSLPKSDFYRFFHDACNYFLSLLGFLFAFLPLYPFVALAIKLDSKGAVLYRQQRAGKRGKPFTLLKFRTMMESADRNGSAWTTKDDDRITRVGRWLRKYRLDELPQLLNVLKGEMALIGPRPEAVDLVESFKQQIPFYDYRYLVRPGVTGWAQVNYENTCSVEGALEKLQYDLYWIKNRSFWLDLKIIFKSIKVMLTGFGAV